jgi:hypothetical protein
MLNVIMLSAVGPCRAIGEGFYKFTKRGVREGAGEVILSGVGVVLLSD